MQKGPKFITRIFWNRFITFEIVPTSWSTESLEDCWRDLNSLPIGSMYAIYGNIYHQYTPNVSIYTIHRSYGLWMHVLKIAVCMSWSIEGLHLHPVSVGGSKQWGNKVSWKMASDMAWPFFGALGRSRHPHLAQKISCMKVPITLLNYPVNSPYKSILCWLNSVNQTTCFDGKIM